jgi:hypothetical protein
VRGVSDSEVDAVQQMARHFRSMDRRLGGAQVRPLLADYLTTTVHDLLRNGRASDRTRIADRIIREWQDGQDTANAVGW